MSWLRRLVGAYAVAFWVTVALAAAAAVLVWTYYATRLM